MRVRFAMCINEGTDLNKDGLDSVNDGKLASRVFIKF